MASDRDVQPDFNDDASTKKNIGQKRSRSNDVDNDPQQLPNKRARYDDNTTIHNENNNGHHHHNHDNKSWFQLEPKKRSVINIQLNNINSKAHNEHAQHSADLHSQQNNGRGTLSQNMLLSHNNNIDNIVSNAIIMKPIECNATAENEAKTEEEMNHRLASHPRSRSRSHSVSSSQSLSSISRSPSRSRSRSYSKRKHNRQKNRNRNRKRRNHRKNRKEYSRSNGSHSNGNRLRSSRSLSRRKHSSSSKHSHSRSRRSSSIRHTSSSHLSPANLTMHSIPYNNNAHNALLVGGQHISFPKTNILPSVLQTGGRAVECIASIAIPQSGPQKFKTTLCSNYMSGGCRFGARCHFAHGSNELRGCRAGAEAEKIWRSKLCREFAKGTCHWGAKCRFAHGATAATKSVSNSPSSCTNCTKSMAMVERYKNEINQLRVENERFKEEIASYKHQSTSSQRKSSK